MSGKNVDVRLKLTADTKDGEKAEQALKDVGDAAKKAQIDQSNTQGTKAAALSIDALEQEVKQLQRELKQLPVDSEAFVNMAGKVKVAEQALDKATASANKLGATTGRRGNAGLALLEFSRAFEDFQFAGIRGAANNLPGLVAMLGGPAGLAAVVSLSAVGASMLWPELNKMGWESKQAASEADKLKDRLAELKDEFDSLIERREDFQNQKLTNTFDDEVAALGRQTEELRQNIELLKEREKLSADISKLQDSIALGDIDRKEATGGITSDEASRRRQQIKAESSAREIERLERLGRLDIQRYEIEEESARQRLLAAVENKASVDSQFAALRKQREEVQKLLNEYQSIVDGGGSQPASGFESATDVARRVQRLFEIEELLRGLGTKVPEVLEPADPNIRGSRPVRDPATEAETPAAVEQRMKELAKQLNNLQEETERLAKAEEDARREIQDAKAATVRARTANSSKQENERTGRTAEEISQDIEGSSGRQTEAQEAAGEALSRVLETILSGISNAGNNANVQNNAQQLRDLLADGFQVSEEGEAIGLLNQLISKFDGDASKRASVYREFLGVLGVAAETDRAAIREISSLKLQFERLSSQVEQTLSNPNP